MSDAAAPVVDEPLHVAVESIHSAPGWLGPLLGGGVLSAVSAAGSFAIEKKGPTVKTLGRDFILGAIFFLLISQLLPESTGKLVAAVLGLFAFSFTSNPIEASTSLLEEMEVKVGVSPF
jgi:hypothetical protein